MIMKTQWSLDASFTGRRKNYYEFCLALEGMANGSAPCRESVGLVRSRNSSLALNECEYFWTLQKQKHTVSILTFCWVSYRYKKTFMSFCSNNIIVYCPRKLVTNSLGYHLGTIEDVNFISLQFCNMMINSRLCTVYGFGWEVLLFGACTIYLTLDTSSLYATRTLPRNIIALCIISMSESSLHYHKQKL